MAVHDVAGCRAEQPRFCLQGRGAGAGRAPAELTPDRNALLGARAESPTSAFQGEERGRCLQRRRGRLRSALVQVDARALCAQCGAGRSAAHMGRVMVLIVPLQHQALDVSDTQGRR